MTGCSARRTSVFALYAGGEGRSYPSPPVPQEELRMPRHKLVDQRTFHFRRTWRHSRWRWCHTRGDSAARRRG